MNKTSRRKFLKSIAYGIGVVAVAVSGIIPVIKGWTKKMRPPGALVEQEFLASCIKCGQCVQVCPVNAIKLADIDDGLGVGTPFIESREQACDFSCDALQCVLACPTGALTHHLNFPHEVKMAKAEVVNPKICLAAQGKGFKGVTRGSEFDGKLRYNEIDRWNPIAVNTYKYDLEICDLCVRQCPIEIRIQQCENGTPPSGDPQQCPPIHAIRLIEIGNSDNGNKYLPEILEGCVGCGVCEMVCPTEPSVIDMSGLIGSGREML